LHHFGEVMHKPTQIWWAVTAIGVATAVFLWVYDRVFRIQDQTATHAAAQ
jgi:hypothetical protein